MASKGVGRVKRSYHPSCNNAWMLLAFAWGLLIVLCLSTSTDDTHIDKFVHTNVLELKMLRGVISSVSIVCIIIQ